MKNWAELSKILDFMRRNFITKKNFFPGAFPLGSKVDYYYIRAISF